MTTLAPRLVFNCCGRLGASPFHQRSPLPFGSIVGTHHIPTVHVMLRGWWRGMQCTPRRILPSLPNKGSALLCPYDVQEATTFELCTVLGCHAHDCGDCAWTPRAACYVQVKSKGPHVRRCMVDVKSVVLFPPSSLTHTPTSACQ